MTDIEKLLEIENQMEKKYKKYKEKLFSSLETLRNLENKNEKIKIIKDLYAYIKEISSEFYLEEQKEFIRCNLLFRY